MRNNDTVRTKDGKIITKNAELLNCYFGCNYAAYMRSTYIISPTTMVWMVTLDGTEKDGWRNKRMGDTIVEEYVGSKVLLPMSLMEGVEHTRRIVFEKVPCGKSNCFVFRGVYELNKPEAPYYKRELKKVSDEIQLFAAF